MKETDAQKNARRKIASWVSFRVLFTVSYRQSFLLYFTSSLNFVNIVSP